MKKSEIKELEKEIKLLKEYKELLEKCIELKNQLIDYPYPTYPIITYTGTIVDYITIPNDY